MEEENIRTIGVEIKSVDTNGMGDREGNPLDINWR